MESDTLKRFDRLVAILIQLQSKRIVKAQEIAERFQVSLRTIYRDLRTLEHAGVPLIGETGSGYSLMEGYRLPPVMFSREEASSFLAAEKLMQQFSDQSLGKYYESALFKIKSVLRGAEKDWVMALDAYISVKKREPAFNKDVPNAMELLFESLAEKKQIKLEYQAIHTNQPDERYIEPVGLFYENQFWYIFGYCHLRKDYRQFRLDRIHSIQRTGIPFTLTHGKVEDYPKQKDDTPKQKVRILVDKKIVQYLRYNYQYYGFRSEKETEKGIEITFMINEIEEGFVRWMLMFADYARILEPASLKDKVKGILRKSIEIIDKE